jgi:hypothetical protein
MENLKKTTHCKVEYNTITKYNKETNSMVVEINGVHYKVDFAPRPTATISELYAVYYKGVRFPSLANLMKKIQLLNN